MVVFILLKSMVGLEFLAMENNQPTNNRYGGNYGDVEPPVIWSEDAWG
jgi:hypothetical protein